VKNYKLKWRRRGYKNTSNICTSTLCGGVNTVCSVGLKEGRGEGARARVCVCGGVWGCGCVSLFKEHKEPQYDLCTKIITICELATDVLKADSVIFP
jgi:hypothetical protein